MNVKLVYDDDKDRRLMELIDTKTPIFIDFINCNTVDGKKEAYRIKSHWAAKMNPFIEVDQKVVFYSEKNNAVNQFIQWLNDSSKIQETS